LNVRDLFRRFLEFRPAAPSVYPPWRANLFGVYTAFDRFFMIRAIAGIRFPARANSKIPGSKELIGKAGTDEKDLRKLS
jgi:hypothetical protein